MKKIDSPIARVAYGERKHIEGPGLKLNVTGDGSVEETQPFLQGLPADSVVNSVYDIPIHQAWQKVKAGDDAQPARLLGDGWKATESNENATAFALVTPGNPNSQHLIFGRGENSNSMVLLNEFQIVGDSKEPLAGIFRHTISLKNTPGDTVATEHISLIQDAAERMLYPLEYHVAQLPGVTK